MDDFTYDSATGKAYSTMQLVKKEVHQGTAGVTGMQHTGSPKQWQEFFGFGYGL